MSFWEDFFSTDKIIYAAIGSFLAGVILIVISLLLNQEFNEIVLGASMGVGFVIGNYIKVNKLKEERRRLRKKRKAEKQVKETG
jgi:hypothetical protein